MNKHLKEIIEDYISDIQYILELTPDINDKVFYRTKLKNLTTVLEYLKCKEDFNYFKNNYIKYNEK